MFFAKIIRHDAVFMHNRALTLYLKHKRLMYWTVKRRLMSVNVETYLNFK